MTPGILAHRGFWRTACEKNTREAIERAFAQGYGIETDVRDLAGELVVAHDPPLSAEGQPILADVVALWQRFGCPGRLALNVKADGLAPAIAKAMSGCDPSSWFVFDMSIPDAMRHLQVGNPLYVRASERESPTPWFVGSGCRASGIWLDALSGPWYGESEWALLAALRCPIAVVSEELHGRPHATQWRLLKTLCADVSLQICTDFPDIARQQLCT